MLILQLLLQNCKRFRDFIFLETEIFRTIFRLHGKPIVTIPAFLNCNSRLLAENTGSLYSKLTIGAKSVMIATETMCISFTWCPVKGIFLRF
jgi:hypothetical protein